MKYENAVYPNREKLMELVNSKDTSPIVMVNLLKFRDIAEYKDGRDEMRYGAKMQPLVESRGGRFLVSAALKEVVIGEVEGLWDVVALMEYPSAAEFVAIASSPEVAEIGVDREAGLAGQLLILSNLR
jgi:uncharacterized protein (DUF1330 family)